MARIVFENQDSWMVKNRVFDRFVASVIQQNQKDRQLGEALQIAIYHNLLHFSLIRAKDGDLVDRIIPALRTTAKSIVHEDGSELAGMEAQERKMFLDAIAELLALLEKASSANKN